jgi:hypothetical protein
MDQIAAERKPFPLAGDWGCALLGVAPHTIWQGRRTGTPTGLLGLDMLVCFLGYKCAEWTMLGKRHTVLPLGLYTGAENFLSGRWAELSKWVRSKLERAHYISPANRPASHTLSGILPSFIFLVVKQELPAIVPTLDSIFSL